MRTNVSEPTFRQGKSCVRSAYACARRCVSLHRHLADKSCDLMRPHVSFRLAQGPTTDIILSAAPRDEIGVASGVNDSVREIGGTIGVAVLGSILTHVYRGRMAETASGAPSGAGDSIMAAQQIADALPGAAQRTALRTAAGDAFLSALHLNCLILTGAALAGSALIALGLARRGRSSR